MSPNGQDFVTYPPGQMCLNSWSGNARCLIKLDSSIGDGHPFFSNDGDHLAVVQIRGTGAAVWIFDVVTAIGKSVTTAGLTADTSEPSLLNYHGSGWDSAGHGFYILLGPAPNETDGQLMYVPIDGSAPSFLPVPISIVNGGSTIHAADGGVLFSSTTGAAGSGQLWWLSASGALSQVGTGVHSDGPISVLAVSADGTSAAICPTSTGAFGGLELIDLLTGAIDKLQDDNVCRGAAYSAHNQSLLMAGPIADKMAITVIDLGSKAVIVQEVITGEMQAGPSTVTWNSTGLATVASWDWLRSGAAINVVLLDNI